LTGHLNRVAMTASFRLRRDSTVTISVSRKNNTKNAEIRGDSEVPRFHSEESILKNFATEDFYQISVEKYKINVLRMLKIVCSFSFKRISASIPSRFAKQPEKVLWMDCELIGFNQFIKRPAF